jgi:hypothetical protein
MSNIIDSIQLSGVTYTIQGSGGGKTIEAGRGISVTTGETADTVSFNLPISAGTGTNSIAEGNYTQATGGQSHAEGDGTMANGISSHAEGASTTASGICSHAEGYYTQARGGNSHAEGNAAQARGNDSHAEGNQTIANGNCSHAEGNQTIANGNYSHAEGYNTSVDGSYSHAEGFYALVNGNYSHAEGNGTVAYNDSEHASGQHNVSSKASTTFGDSGNTLFSVGNGTAYNARHNAFEVRQNGDIYLSSGGTDIKLQDHLGGGSITVDTALDSGSTNPVENRVIYNKFDEVEQVTAAGLNALNSAISGISGNNVVELTQAQYDALVTGGTVDPTAFYIITDATPVDMSQYWTSAQTQSAITSAVSTKQDTLSAGTGIDITDNVISATGGSITIDPSLDSGSTNAVANSAITTAINDRQLKKEYVASEKVFSSTDTVYGRTIYHPVFRCYSNNSTNTELVLNNKDLGLYFPSVNGKKIFSASKTETDWLGDVIEASAITTTISSGSTDTQVPSAKAMYDKFDEVEQVTAAALNTLNDAFGGLKLMKISQTDYNNLQVKDQNTLYIIVN